MLDENVKLVPGHVLLRHFVGRPCMVVSYVGSDAGGDLITILVPRAERPTVVQRSELTLASDWLFGLPDRFEEAGPFLPSDRAAVLSSVLHALVNDGLQELVERLTHVGLGPRPPW